MMYHKSNVDMNHENLTDTYDNARGCSHGTKFGELFFFFFTEYSEIGGTSYNIG